MPTFECKKRLIAFMNKAHVNPMQGDIVPMDYHGMFFTSAKWYNLMENKTGSLWLYFLPICTTISAMVAATLFMISLVHYVQTFQIHLITECGTYLIVMIYKLVIRVSMTRGKKHFPILLAALQSDFSYVCTKKQKYREKFFEHQKLTFQACVFAVLLLGFLGGGMTMCAFIALGLALISKDENVKRPLPYPIWLFDHDLQESPAYEILFVASVIFTVFHTKQLIFMVQCHLLWIRQIVCRADIIIWTLEDLLIDVTPAKTKEERIHFEALIKHRMRHIIEMHHSMYILLDGYAGVLKPCLFYEQIFAGGVICLCAYVFAEKYDQGEFRLILLLLSSGTVGMVLIPCYLCTYLLEKIQSIGDACWNTPFWNAGPLIGPYLVLIMARSMRALPIVAAGFDDISLQTYSRMMTRAYSCFNMLRQADLNLG